MKTTRFRWYVFYALVGLMGAAGSMLWAQSGRPTLAATSYIHDFGVVETGEQLQYAFEIKNQGREPLKINAVQISCGCIKDAHVNNNFIAPGQSSKLLVTWESPSYYTEVEESIKIESNDPVNPSRSFIVKAKVWPVLVVRPAALNFGLLTESDLPSSQEAVVQPNTAGESTERLAFSVKSASTFKIESGHLKGSPWGFTLTIPTGFPVGPLDGKVEVLPHNGPPKTVLILGEVVGDVSAEPKEVFVDNTQQVTGTQEIVFTSEKSKVINVKAVFISPDLNPVMTLSTSATKLFANYDLSDPTSPRFAKGDILLEVVTSDGLHHRYWTLIC